MRHSSEEIVRGIGVIVSAVMMCTPTTSAQTVTAQADTPKWEAVSIKPCKPAEAGRGGRGGGGRGGGGIPVSAPGRLDLRCSTVMQFIRQAYVTYADGKGNSSLVNVVSIEGGPSWIRSDLYDLTAKAEGNPSPEKMRGPMLQAVLEDRLQVKVHRETRDVPAYAISVAKGGLKVKPLEEKSCDPPDLTKPMRPARLTPDALTEILQPGEKPTCGRAGHSSYGPADPMMTVHGLAMTLSEFSQLIVFDVGRPVIDKTGITGIFNFHLRFATDPTRTPPRGGAEPVGNSPAASSDPVGPSIFTAIQEQLGLKLESAKGPGDFLVIDSVERPTEN